MSDMLLERLRDASGASCQVLATFIDVRGFSSFAGVAESTDTALYLRSMYTRVLDEYFSDAVFFKPTGDGLMIINRLEGDVEELKAVLQDKVKRALELVEKFPTLTEDDVLINFEVPRHLGVGMARGSATELVSSDGVIIDYSGRCLNLAARLMDLARPEGVVFQDRHAARLLGDELLSKLESESVYVRGIAESSPMEVYIASDWVQLPSSARTPPKRTRSFDEPEELTVKTITEHNGTHLVPLKRTPFEPYDVEVAGEYPAFRENGERIGTVSTFRLPAKVVEEPDGFYARVNLETVRRKLRGDNVTDEKVRVTLTPYH